MAQLDFEVGLHSTSRMARFYGLFTIAVVLFVWEVGREAGYFVPNECEKDVVG
jgi:hypothetical protein